MLDDDCLAVAVGDISGHGVPAALLMAHLRTSFHATAHGGRSAEDIVTDSDGIPEAPIGKQFYGKGRSHERALVLARSGATASVFVGDILPDVRVVADAGMHDDDVTLVLVRCT